MNPLSLVKPVRSLPCKYIVHPDDGALVATLKAAEAAAPEGDTVLKVAVVRIRAMPSTT